MILCLNTNAALDRILFIKRFMPHTHMRVTEELLCVGGKSLDTALVLQSLGAPVQAISFMAGRNGQIVETLLGRLGIPCEYIWLQGETRVATIIVETEINRHSHITTSGYQVNSSDCDEFTELVEKFGLQADWAVIAGTMPPGAPSNFYDQLINRLHQQGVQVLIDAFGKPMIEALAGQPEIVKMNRDEFFETFEISVDNIEMWPDVCHRVMNDWSIKHLVITHGKEGILACTPEGDYYCGGPEVIEVNAAGAGDAVSAALVYRLSLGDTWEQALVWAAAAGAAVVLTPGTAECYLEDVQKFYPHIWVRKM